MFAPWAAVWREVDLDLIDVGLSTSLHWAPHQRGGLKRFNPQSSLLTRSRIVNNEAPHKISKSIWLFQKLNIMKNKSKQRAPLASDHWMINWSWPNFLCFVKGGCFSCFRLSTCVCVCQLVCVCLARFSCAMRIVHVLLCTNKPIVVQRRSQICLFLERLPDSSILCSPFWLFQQQLKLETQNWPHMSPNVSWNMLHESPLAI